eukprot:COSAG06_NODE_373_length_16684_cov_3.035574_5_plen_294_part_00
MTSKAITAKHILFMGSPDFAKPCLAALIQHFPNSQISVCTQADKPSGRNKKITPTPIKKLALKHNLSTYTPTSKQALTDCVKTINPSLIIVVAYGFILEAAITDHYCCINVHGSLLPKYRGATPMQAALLNQDKETGVTLIQMDQGCDTGPMLAKASYLIKQADQINHLHDHLAQLGAETLIDYLNNMLKTGQIHSTKQDNRQASHCQKINKADLLLNLKDPAEKNLAKIKAYSPIPGAYFIHQNKRFKVLKASIKHNKLDINIIQPEGKKAMGFDDACKGYPELRGQTPCIL